MKIKLIDVDERKDLRCYFCGTSKSVKYKIALFNNNSIQDINERCCCNKCACIFIDELSELPGGVTK